MRPGHIPLYDFLLREAFRIHPFKLLHMPFPGGTFAGAAGEIFLDGAGVAGDGCAEYADLVEGVELAPAAAGAPVEVVEQAAPGGLVIGEYGYVGADRRLAVDVRFAHLREESVEIGVVDVAERESEEAYTVGRHHFGKHLRRVVARVEAFAHIFASLPAVDAVTEAEDDVAVLEVSVDMAAAEAGVKAEAPGDGVEVGVVETVHGFVPETVLRLLEVGQICLQHTCGAGVITYGPGLRFGEVGGEAFRQAFVGVLVPGKR